MRLMPLYPGESTFPSETTFPSGLDEEKLLVLYTTSPASDPSPTWVYANGGAADRLVRRYETSRGRDSELSDIDAGTATIVLDNRARTFDPTLNTAIKPGNRWWIRERFRGVDQDVIVVYADSYDQQWPDRAGKVDAVAVMSGSDELKRLARDKLPVMTPPRDTYADLVKSDEPAAYWRFHDFNNLAGDPGPAWTLPTSGSGGYAIAVTQSPIVGDSKPERGVLAMQDNGFVVVTNPDAFDTQRSGAVTVEFWFKYTTVPAATAQFLGGRTDAAGNNRNFYFAMLDTGAVRFNLNGGTSNVDSAPLAANTWHHIAGTLSSTTMRIYVNGAQAASATGPADIDTAIDDYSTTIFPEIRGVTAAASFLYLDELAFYPARDLGATRIAAHYQAGALRGFAYGQSPLLAGSALGIRAESILAAADNLTPRLRVGGSTRLMQGSFMRGQDVLGELRTVIDAEKPNGVMFAGRDGTLVFLGNEHRDASPYNTVQAIFDDDGTDNAYRDLDVDYSESFLVNDVSVTGKGSLASGTASDVTSISEHGRRPVSLTDLLITEDVNAAQDIADELLAKYKNPMLRARSYRPKMGDPDVAAAVNALDIGDRIRVFRTPVGGGARIDETLFVQRIDRSGEPGRPRVVTLGVSPL